MKLSRRLIKKVPYRNNPTPLLKRSMSEPKRPDRNNPKEAGNQIKAVPNTGKIDASAIMKPQKIGELTPNIIKPIAPTEPWAIAVMK